MKRQCSTMRWLLAACALAISLGATAASLPASAADLQPGDEDCNVTPCYCWSVCLDQVGDSNYCNIMYGQYCN